MSKKLIAIFLGGLIGVLIVAPLPAVWADFLDGESVIESQSFDEFGLKFKEPVKIGPQGHKISLRPESAGDINNDGDIDVVIGDYDGNVYVVLNKGDGNFENSAQYSTGYSTHAPVLEDFNNDGYLDFAVEQNVSPRVHVFINNQDNTFSQTTYDVPNYANRINFSEMNNDDYIDIIVGSGYGGSGEKGGSISLLINQQNGAFSSPIITSLPYYIGAPKGIDLDNDGDKDIIATGGESKFSPLEIVLLENIGQNQFIVHNVINGYHRSRYGDYNNDGMMDFVAINEDLTDFTLFTNRGNFNFESECYHDYGWAGFFTDYNQDGWLDLQTMDGVLFNDHGSFNNDFIAFNFSHFFTPMAAADMNNDGYVDIVGLIRENNTRYLAISYQEPQESRLWVEINRDGACIYNDRNGSPPLEDELKGNRLKCLPTGWVLKRELDEDNNPIEKSLGGEEVRWFNKVEDVTNRVLGWVERGDLNYYKNKQKEWKERTDSIESVDERKKIILDALKNYYYNTSTKSSLYSSNDKSNDGTNNQFSIFKNEEFPIELILSVIINETGGHDFDNECCCYSGDEGTGVMQITGDSKGWGSKLECQKSGCLSNNGDFCYQKCVYCSKCYGNAEQGIYANIKDGLRVLQWGYQDARNKNADNKIAGAVWRYRMGPNWKHEVGKDYLVKLANNLKEKELVKIFPNYQEYFEEILTADELKNWTVILKNYYQATIHSPGELRVYDSQGKMTGSVSGKVKNEILNADYYEGNFIVFDPSDSYYYKVIGADTGIYGLDITSVENGESTIFNAVDIPTTPGQIHQYSVDWQALSQGEKGVTLQIDADGNGEFEQTITADATLQPPMANAGNFYIGDEGLPIIFDASLSTDFDGEIVLYEWDFNGDEIYDVNSISPIIEHTWGDDYQGEVSLRVINDEGLTNTNTAEVVVNNVVPIVEAGPDQVVNEGDAVQFSGSFTDLGWLDTHTIYWDFGDAAIIPDSPIEEPGQPQEPEESVPEEPVEEPSEQEQPIIDPDGPQYDEPTEPSEPVVESAQIESEPIEEPIEENPLPPTWPTDPEPEPTPELEPEQESYQTLTPTYTYGDNGVYTVTLTIIDDDGGIGIDTLTVTVNNVPPAIFNLAVEAPAHPSQEIWAGDALHFSADFTDSGWLDTHTAIWNFGDGATSTGTVIEENIPIDATGTVAGSHIFYNKRSYTVTLIVEDDDGGIGTNTIQVVVKPIPATIDCDPDTLNIDSNGKWITCYIELPEGYDAQQIDGSIVFLNGIPAYFGKQGWATVEANQSNIGDYDNNGILERMVKFNRQTVQENIEVGENVEIVITGQVFYNQGFVDFQGSDITRVTDKDNNKDE